MASIRLNPPLVIAAASIFPPLCFCAVALRFYSRRMQRKGLGIDDWLTIPGLILVIGISATILRGVALQSVAYPTPPVAPELALTTSSFQQTITREVFFACEIMQVLALGCIKLSCMFFYRRIFRTGNSRVRDIVWYCCTGFIIIWMTAFFFALMLPCGTQIQWLWGSLEEEAQCASTFKLQLTYATTDVLTDLIVLIFPIIPVWRLRISTKSKVGVTVVFCLGALALMASLTRLVVYVQALTVEFAATPPDEDLLTTAAIYFVYLETGIGLLGCCLPAMYGLFAAQGLQTILKSVASMLSITTTSRSTNSTEVSEKGSQRPTSSQNSSVSPSQARSQSARR